jgi:hypothetical protein
MKTTILHNQPYSLVRERLHSPVSIYQDEKSVLRVGPESVLRPELLKHQEMIENGFPVPQILEEGRLGDNFYYLEEKINGERLSDLLQTEYKEQQRISPDRFSQLQTIAHQYLTAQLNHKLEHTISTDAATGIHLEDLLNELPNQRDHFLSAFELFTQHTENLPVVLTHGDFNPFNLFPNQVIDFGASFRGPVGYDVVSNIFHVYYFPPSEGYEIKRLFDSSPEQIDEYLQYFDQVFIEHGLPALTLFLNDFIFARMVWAVVRMHRMPLLQSWRYELITKTVVDYLQGLDLKEKLLKVY